MTLDQAITQFIAVYLLYLLFLAVSGLKMYKVLAIEQSENTKNVYFLAILIVVFASFYNADSDYYAYMGWFENPDAGNMNEHMEPIHNFIRGILPSYYCLYRILIWGGGMFYFIRLCNLVNVNKLIALSIFGWFYITYYSYARASLAIIVCIYGYLYYIKYSQTDRNKLFFLKCIAYVALSCALHKSVAGLWVICFISYFIKYDKKSIISMVLLFYPISALLHTNFVTMASQYLNFADATYSDYYVNFLQSIEERDLSREIYHHLPAIFLFVYSLLSMGKSKYEISKLTERTIMLTICILYVGLEFITLQNYVTMSMRYLLMAYPPAIIVCAYYMTNYKCKRFLIMSLFIYSFYCIGLPMYFKIAHNEFTNYLFERY